MFRKEKTQQLFSLIELARSEENVDDTELLQLNTEIENFYKIKDDGRKFI